MRMSIEKMRIANFKGVRELTIDFGDVTHIKGMNGTGKTTIPDAFCWCLWNKDSHGNAPGSDAFHEKPLDADGKEVHNLDTMVELICNLDGQSFNLRRVQRENWVKKRGNAQATYQGNVSTYWINDVEVKQSDFRARIAQIASDEVFRLIGSLSAFNGIEWKKRRQQLLALCDIDVDPELLSRAEYRAIADEIAQRNISVDELRTVAADQRKRANEELRMIPVRIDEAKRALPEFKPGEVKDAEYIIQDSLKDIAKIDGYISELRANGQTAGSQSQLVALETELISHKRRLLDDCEVEKRRVQESLNHASQMFRQATVSVADVERKIALAKLRLSEKATMRDKLRAEYSSAYEKKFVADSVCPVCNQPMPSEVVDAARKKFEQRRRGELSEIKQKGQAVALEIEQLEGSIKADCELRNDLEGDAKARIAERDAFAKELEALSMEPDYSSEPRIAELGQQIAELKKAIETSPDAKISSLEERKAELTVIVEMNRAVLARRDAGLEVEKRISELTNRQHELGIRVSELEQLIALIEKFVQDRCSALEETVNAKFPTVRWKLFDVQINGGITDVCTCMIPCESGLVSYESANTAAQVNADIEIINVLSEHYDLSLPLFVDNSERVNVLRPTESQLITLSVSTDSELKVETDKEVV